MVVRFIYSDLGTAPTLEALVQTTIAIYILKAKIDYRGTASYGLCVCGIYMRSHKDGASRISGIIYTLNIKLTLKTTLYIVQLAKASKQDPA